MQLIRKCHSLPSMRFHTFSAQSVCLSRGPVNLIPALEKAGFTDLLPLEFAEWITRKVITHFLPNTEPAQVVYSTDVADWIGEPLYIHAQNNVTLSFIQYFDNPDGIVVLLVALYYLTSHRDRFTCENLSDEIIEEMNDLDEELRLREAIRLGVLIYASAVRLATTWLLDDVRGERRYWASLLCDETHVQGAEINTRTMLEVMDYRLSVDLEDLIEWVNQAVEQFPIECF